MNFDTSRVNIDKLIKQYQEYLALYKAVNHGSIDGATGFDVFYLRMTYHSKYEDERAFLTTAV